jgi:hypothetical protein
MASHTFFQASAFFRSTFRFSSHFAGFWVFGKLIQNLADIGYDSSLLYSANYDWRLSPQLLETRDGYYSKYALKLFWSESQVFSFKFVR